MAPLLIALIVLCCLLAAGAVYLLLALEVLPVLPQKLRSGPVDETALSFPKATMSSAPASACSAIFPTPRAFLRTNSISIFRRTPTKRSPFPLSCGSTAAALSQAKRKAPRT